MRKGLMTITIVFFLSIIFIGEIYTYTDGVVHYDSYAYRDIENNNVINYSVSSSGTNDYCAVLINNNGFERVKELWIYVDEGYEDRLSQAEEYHSLPNKSLERLCEQIKLGLEMRSFTNVKICNSHELIEHIKETHQNPSGYGILSISYALPGEIYKGNLGDYLIRWVEKGGCLYWAGSVPGEFCIDSEGNLEHIPVKNVCELFFNAQENCINFGHSDVSPLSISNNFTKSLMMKNDSYEFAVDETKITAKHIILGTIRGNYVSEILMNYGKGMLVQFSGGYGIYQVEDICQTIASGLCYKSEIDNYKCGRVTRTTIHETIQRDVLSEESDKKILYIFVGKTYPSYGRAWDV